CLGRSSQSGHIFTILRDALVENSPVSSTFAPSASRKSKRPKRLNRHLVSLFLRDFPVCEPDRGNRRPVGMDRMKKKNSKSAPRANSHLRIGVDTGGTFTDFIVIFKDRFIAFKLPSTPQSPEEAILAGLARAFDELSNGFEMSSEAVGDDSSNPIRSRASGTAIEIIHGTTVATKALVEQESGPAG